MTTDDTGRQGDQWIRSRVARNRYTGHAGGSTSGDDWLRSEVAAKRATQQAAAEPPAEPPTLPARPDLGQGDRGEPLNPPAVDLGALVDESIRRVRRSPRRPERIEVEVRTNGGTTR